MSSYNSKKKTWKENKGKNDIEYYTKEEIKRLDKSMKRQAINQMMMKYINLCKNIKMMTMQ